MVIPENAADTGLIPEDADVGGLLPPGPVRPPDYRQLYELERTRGDAADTRCEALRRSDMPVPWRGA